MYDENDNEVHLPEFPPSEDCDLTRRYPQERWREVAEFPNYEVSDRGLVRRAIGGPGGMRRVLCPFLSTDGYRVFTLRRDGLPSNTARHRS